MGKVKNITQNLNQLNESNGVFWKKSSVFWSSFMAKNFVDKDIILVAAGYDIAPNGKKYLLASQNAHLE